MKNGMIISQKVKHSIVIWSTLILVYTPKIEIRNLKIYLYINIHNDIIHNSLQLVNGCMAKQNVVCTYNGIFFNIKQ